MSKMAWSSVASSDGRRQNGSYNEVEKGEQVDEEEEAGEGDFVTVQDQFEDEEEEVDKHECEEEGSDQQDNEESTIQDVNIEEGQEIQDN